MLDQFPASHWGSRRRTLIVSYLSARTGKRCAQFVTEKADINIGTAPGKESKCEARGLLGTDEVNDSTLAADLFKNSRNYLRGLAVRCKTAPYCD